MATTNIRPPTTANSIPNTGIIKPTIIAKIITATDFQNNAPCNSALKRTSSPLTRTFSISLS